MTGLGPATKCPQTTARLNGRSPVEEEKDPLRIDSLLR
jgi:hypothetical protein